MLEYIVAFNHRSGSSWLMSLLDTSGLGPCREFHDFVDTHIEKHDRVEEFQDCAGVKVEYHALVSLKKQYDISNCKIIRLRRRDIIRQAISWYRSIHTLRWSCFDINNNSEPSFNDNSVMFLIQTLLEYDYSWDAWLEGKDYLEVWYEDLLSDQARVLRSISIFLDKPIARQPSTSFKIQRDDLTEIYYQQFMTRKTLYDRVHRML